jgi:DNA integrity scanning protein DisA with diadenylate cyclase activity
LCRGVSGQTDSLDRLRHFAAERLFPLQDAFRPSIIRGSLDGAFIVRGDAVVLTAGSHLMPSPAASTRLTSGLGTRHGAVAGISAPTGAVAICVSQSTGTVSVYKSGHLVTDSQRLTHGGQFPICRQGE